MALAEHVGGSITNFAELMNDKAKELKLNSTSFVTPHGLDEDNHYTTAYELAQIADYALNIKEFINIVGTKNYNVYINGKPKNITNTNELLGNLNGVYGIKTGFTNGANRCLVTAIKRENMDIICVVLGADTKKNRTEDSARLIEYAFTNYEMINIKKIVEEKFEVWKNNNKINVIKGKKDNIEYMCDFTSTDYYPIYKEDIKNIDVQIASIEKVNAPVYLNQELGEIKVLSNDKEILIFKITANEDVNKKEIYDYFFDFISKYNIYIEESMEPRRLNIKLLCLIV